MAKEKIMYFCQSCGAESGKWMGQCPACKEWNTMVEERVSKKKTVSSFQNEGRAKVTKLKDIEMAREERICTDIAELDRVLGGGMVTGSMVLVGGDPGIGKSTLLLQVCKNLVIDSIQTMYNENVSSAPGSVSQVRETTGSLLKMAKGLGITFFIIGHVTKEGVVAGPRVLEHMVDTVLYFEGDRHAAYRILRGVKNRFGSTNEIGVFEMRGNGLEEVENPSEFMLGGKPKGASGSVVACSIEGTRPILLEVQALVCHSNFGIPRRTAAGTDFNRVNLLMAVLEKRAGLQMGACDAYVNIAGGIKMNEPAIDLGIVLALVSSYKNRPVEEKTICFGEVGLSGEVRAVNLAEQRILEAKKLGFTTCILPEVSLKSLEEIQGIELIGVKSIKDAIDKAV
ncbi:MAG: DNA repair protein RadA [Lachnospiraceae bacterium]|nr:DNA repair protein RadA [Lachnospiraceae bacterium]